MNWIKAFSIAFFLSSHSPAYAGPEGSSTAEGGEKRFSLTLGGTYGFLLNGTHLGASNAPGASLTLDYRLDSRSSLFFNATAFGRLSDKLGSVGYKYWLTDSGRLRPWAQIGAGMVWTRSDDIFRDDRHPIGSKGNDFQLSFGGGLRYELSDKFGLDLAANLYKAGAPWHWSNSTKLLATSFGGDLRF